MVDHPSRRGACWGPVHPVAEAADVQAETWSSVGDHQRVAPDLGHSQVGVVDQTTTGAHPWVGPETWVAEAKCDLALAD